MSLKCDFRQVINVSVTLHDGDFLIFTDIENYHQDTPMFKRKDCARCVCMMDVNTQSMRVCKNNFYIHTQL